MADMCQVCKAKCDADILVCKVCGFTELHKTFINTDDGDYWYETVVKPYRQEWEFRKREAELLALLEDARKTKEVDSVTSISKPSSDIANELDLHCPDIAAEIQQGKTRNLKFGNYEWRVLELEKEKRANKALIVTENIIGQRPFYSDSNDVSWEACSLRKYLNGYFTRQFSTREKRKIIEVNNTADNRWTSKLVGNRTNDKVFLLSIEEILRCFGHNSQVRERDSGGLVIDDEYNSERIARRGKRNDMAGDWWLRSPGNSPYRIAVVNKHGIVIVGGLTLGCGGLGVRPAIWLNLE